VPTDTASAIPPFSAATEYLDHSVVVRLAGTADLDAKKELDEILTRLHATAQDARASEVVMDFRALKFMNSACVKGLVAWICAVQELPEQNRYRIVLRSSHEARWQRRCLHALWCLASDLVTITS
jgi:hypothetical protein